jgi:membrane-associated phospholipid phosphatase
MHKIAPAWKWLLIVLLAVIAIAASFYFDATVRHWMVEHSNRTAKQVMRNVSRFGDWPEHVAAGLLVVAIAAWRGHKRWVHIGLTMIVACALAGIAARGVKIASGRARPSVKQELGWHGPRLSSKYNSFPSGHTAATTAFFGVLLFTNRRVALALLPIPLLIAASRMYVAAHFLSDVVCAAILGILCAWFCARAFLRP